MFAYTVYLSKLILAIYLSCTRNVTGQVDMLKDRSCVYNVMKGNKGIAAAVVKRKCTTKGWQRVQEIQAIARLGSLGLRLSLPGSGVQNLFRVVVCVCFSSWVNHLSSPFWSSFFDAVAFDEAAGSTVWIKIDFDCTGDKKN
jgi:hypothetical protein